MDAVKISRLEIENVKRIRAVMLEPSENGLTIVGGRNGQGKTSVLDAIAWALGGDKFRPSQAEHVGSDVPPTLRVELSNGLIVERAGKNCDLKVTDPAGHRNGQQLLNGFIEHLALDLPRFMLATSKEKASTLLRIIGVEDKLIALDSEEADAYSRRRYVGQIADQKRKYAMQQPSYPDAPAEEITASELIQQQQAILAQNGENKRKRQNLQRLEKEAEDAQRRVDEQLARQRIVMADLEIARKSAADLHDESTKALEQNLAEIDQVNRKVRANADKMATEVEALEYAKQYNDLSEKIESIRVARMALLNDAALPLPGLSVENGDLTYDGYKWDNLSSSEQLKVATAIVRRLNPQCGFVLLDKLEQMDVDTLREFGDWLESEGLQVIATRVSTGDECSIIIEDGHVVGDGM